MSRVSHLELFPKLSLDPQEGQQETQVPVFQDLGKSLLGAVTLGQHVQQVDFAVGKELAQSRLALGLVQLLQQKHEKGVVGSMLG
jgi:hypothetical protein